MDSSIRAVEYWCLYLEFCAKLPCRRDVKQIERGAIELHERTFAQGARPWTGESSWALRAPCVFPSTPFVCWTGPSPSATPTVHFFRSLFLLHDDDNGALDAGSYFRTNQFHYSLHLLHSLGPAHSNHQSRSQFPPPRIVFRPLPYNTPSLPPRLKRIGRHGRSMLQARGKVLSMSTYCTVD